MPGDIAGQCGQQSVRLVGIQRSIRFICELPDGLVGGAVGLRGLGYGLQLDRLATLEGIAHGLDVRDCDARRAERPEELRLRLLHAAEPGRVHGVDSVAALPPDVHLSLIHISLAFFLWES